MSISHLITHQHMLSMSLINSYIKLLNKDMYVSSFSAIIYI